MTIHVVTNTTNEEVLVAPAPFNNTLIGNRGIAQRRGRWLRRQPGAPCDNDKWRASKFVTVNQPCVVGPGGSGMATGARASARATPTMATMSAMLAVGQQVVASMPEPRRGWKPRSPHMRGPGPRVPSVDSPSLGGDMTAEGGSPPVTT